MRLIRKNVEREAEGAEAERLMKDGFAPIDTSSVEANSSEKVNLKEMKVEDLRRLAAEKEIDNAGSLTRAELLAVLEDVLS